MSNSITDSYASFWQWFSKNSPAFFKIIKQQNDVEGKFFRKLAPKLAKIKEGFYYLVGMADDTTAELVITADGHIEQIVFVEELVATAPNIPGWKITALKQPSTIEDVAIKIDDHSINSDNLRFYPNSSNAYPDEIDITVVYCNEVAEDDHSLIFNGVYIFLENFLGELTLATVVDNLQIITEAEATAEFISIDKLKDYLIWREKEFVEKYEAVRVTTENDAYASLEATLESGKPLLAIVNTDLLAFDGKASHPWVLVVTIAFDGENNNGLPDQTTYEALDVIEETITAQLPEAEGYLSIGRETVDGQREVYYVCKEFRKPSKVLPLIQAQYADLLDISFSIYKDKYWQSFQKYEH